MIQKIPVFIDLDRRRELVFNLNTEILIRGTAAAGQSVFESVGERIDPDTGKTKPVLRVNADNLRVYLWAALQKDARAKGEVLTLEDVGQLVESNRQVTAAVAAVLLSLNRYYGDEPGEANAPAVK